MKDYIQIGELAKFMIEAVALNPENRNEDGSVNWDFVSSDVYLDYQGEFNDEMINDAIDLIGQANRDNQEYAERRGTHFYEVKGYYQVNPYYAHESGDKKIGRFFKELIEAMNGKDSTVRNHNNSDIMTDYFDVGWYVDVNVGDWQKPYKVTE